MNAAPEVQVVCAPSTSMNPFNNKIDLSTKEGIPVWKTATDPNKLLDGIALTLENGDKFLDRMKSKCSEFQLKKNSSESLPPGTASQRTCEEVTRTILVNTESFCIPITNSLKIKSSR